MSTTKRDYYEVLGLNKGASADEIKRAFRRKAKEYHPDTNTSPEAEALFKELGEAYGVLSDPQRREIYDSYGHEGLNRSGGGAQTNWDFMDGFPDLSDIFASFFGGGFGYGGRGGQRNAPQRGDDLRIGLGLTFQEAAFGVKKEVEVTHLNNCETCRGDGADPDAGQSVCTTCGGSGQIRQTTQTIIGHFTQIILCTRCHGQGVVVLQPCKTCQGKGRQPETKKLSITVPAGVDNGTRLRVANEGNAGVLGGPPGDLYVVIEVQPHERFERDGYNVLSVHPVTYTQLALGAEVEVPTLRGTEKVRIQPGTQSGTVVQLKGAGVPFLQNPNHRGDHLVSLEIRIPTHLSGEEKKALYRLRELEDARQNEQDHPAKDSHPSIFDKMKDVLGGAH